MVQVSDGSVVSAGSKSSADLFGSAGSAGSGGNVGSGGRSGSGGSVSPAEATGGSLYPVSGLPSSSRSSSLT